MPVHRRGGATKKATPSRRNPSGGWGLRVISASLVVDDVTTSPPPRSLTSPRKPHPQMARDFGRPTLIPMVYEILSVALQNQVFTSYIEGRPPGLPTSPMVFGECQVYGNCPMPGGFSSAVWPPPGYAQPQPMLLRRGKVFVKDVSLLEFRRC